MGGSDASGASEWKQQQSRSREAGMDYCVAKPVRLNELQAVVR